MVKISTLEPGMRVKIVDDPVEFRGYDPIEPEWLGKIVTVGEIHQSDDPDEWYFKTVDPEPEYWFYCCDVDYIVSEGTEIPDMQIDWSQIDAAMFSL